MIIAAVIQKKRFFLTGITPRDPMVPLKKNCREGPHLVDEKKFQPDRMKGLEVMRFLKPQILILSKISTISVNMQFR